MVDFIKMLVALVFAALVIFAFFAVAMMPQVGVAYFFALGGLSMLPGLVIFAVLGTLIFVKRERRWELGLVASMVVVMVNMRGLYWHAFPSSAGFWTANRLSGMAIYALALIAPISWAKFLAWRSKR